MFSFGKTLTYKRKGSVACRNSEGLEWDLTEVNSRGSLYYSQLLETTKRVGNRIGREQRTTDIRQHARLISIDYDYYSYLGQRGGALDEKGP